MSARFWEATVDGSPGHIVFGPARNGTYLTFNERTGNADRHDGASVTDLVPAVIDAERPCRSTVNLSTRIPGGVVSQPTTCIKPLSRGGTHKGPHRDSQGREWTT